ncbi:MAG: hypothetical protein ABSC94_20305 [Polyangiaceae bacterium]
MFLTFTVIGLVGLFMMAIPGFGRHGHTHATSGHAPAFGKGAGAIGCHPASVRIEFGKGAGAIGCHPASVRIEGGRAAVGPGGGDARLLRTDGISVRILRMLPSPRFVFTFFALYGAFANALNDAAHLHRPIAAVIAIVPALLVERFVVRPVWNLVFRYQANPSAPLADLWLCEAQAVVAFRNGRGIVSVVRDGRAVQFAATMVEHGEDAVPVRVGDRLRIEDVDSARERLVVSPVRS